MKQRNLPTWNKIHTLIFDFDGVFTDNKVFINQEGLESVQCSRADSLGRYIKKIHKEKNWPLDFLFFQQKVIQSFFLEQKN